MRPERPARTEMRQRQEVTLRAARQPSPESDPAPRRPRRQHRLTLRPAPTALQGVRARLLRKAARLALDLRQPDHRRHPVRLRLAAASPAVVGLGGRHVSPLRKLAMAVRPPRPSPTSLRSSAPARRRPARLELRTPATSVAVVPPKLASDSWTRPLALLLAWRLGRTELLKVRLRTVTLRRPLAP